MSEDTQFKFLNIISKLLRELADAYPSDASIINLQRRFVMARGISETALYNKIGQYLENYTDEIIQLDEDKNFEFFLTEEYDKFYENESKREIIDSIIMKIKSLLMGKSAKEQEKYASYIFSLLELYIRD